ncbi:short-chain dehydrogenase [Botrytis cinerea]
MAAAVATQPHNLPLLVTPETCRGRTYIITGANTGLGLEAARHLVCLGSASVIMAVRDLSSGLRALADIESSTGISGVAQVWELDLSSYASVIAFAKRATEELDRIDAVIENAGTVLLGVLLFPKLKESGERFRTLPHLVIVTSRVSFDFGEDWMKIKDDPIVKSNEEEMTPKAYPLSKLLEIMAIRHLAGLLPLQQTGVVINLEQFGRTAEDGSRTLLYGAIAGEKSHGCFLESCIIAENVIPNWVTDMDGKKSQKIVWDVIARELETIEPGCVEKIFKE